MPAYTPDAIRFMHVELAKATLVVRQFLDARSCNVKIRRIILTHERGVLE